MPIRQILLYVGAVFLAVAASIIWFIYPGVLNAMIANDFSAALVVFLIYAGILACGAVSALMMIVHYMENGALLEQPPRYTPSFRWSGGEH